jgi:hypothetical protein
MHKIIFHFFAMVLLWQPIRVASQPIASISAYNILQEERELFLQHFKSISSDTTIVYQLARYVESEVENIRKTVINDAAFLPELEKEKAIRSLAFFMKEVDKNIAQQKTDMYDIPGALKSYREVLTAILTHKPFVSILVPLNARRTQLLASAFSQYKEHTLIDDMVVYKRISSSPEFILQFLETKPGYKYTDSLLLKAAADDPMKINSYLNQGKRTVQDKIRNNRNIYLQQIVFLSGDKNATELLPFIIPIAEKKLMQEDILVQRKDVTQYFQLLVNTVQESRMAKGDDFLFLKPLRAGVKRKALDFYVNQINELHSSPDAVRFVSVKGLRPEDLYYIITSCGEELYTSSYLGLYKRLMESFKNQSADSLFGIVKYDQFRTFMRLAANYNVLTDFLHNMPPEKMVELVKQFIGGIGNDTEAGLEKAMDIADFFAGLGSATDIIDLIQSELQSNLNRSRTQQQYLGVRLYSILLEVFELVKQGGSQSQLWSKLGNYEILKRSALEDKRGEVVELMLFYGDKDGVASFNNFLKQYADASKWKIEKNPNWVAVRSAIDPTVVIYANIPLETKEDELEMPTQDSLVAYLAQQSLEPAILIHRGHSYHLDKTLKQLTPSVKLAVLGSCGSYNKAISIANINPNVQVIGSRKTGAKSINDPIVEVINETLVEKRDIVWAETWKKLSDRFSKDEQTLSMFNEYFPPDNNLSLFVLKLFMFHS